MYVPSRARVLLRCKLHDKAQPSRRAAKDRSRVAHSTRVRSQRERLRFPALKQPPGSLMSSSVSDHSQGQQSVVHGESARESEEQARILVAIHSGISPKPTRLSPFAQTHVALAPLRARATHIVQLGTISLIGQHCPPITGELGAQFQSRRGEI
jgi:hypothetical protein